MGIFSKLIPQSKKTAPGAEQRVRTLLAGLDEPMRVVHKESLGHLTRVEIRELNRLLVKARQPFLEGDNDD